MKKIKIAHLYYDLMNLYGENGNMRLFIKKLESHGIQVEISFLTVDDKIDFNKYDFFYIGSGTESNQKIVINDLLKYKTSINKAIEDNRFFLITGNALEIFGSHIECLDSTHIETLGALSYYTKEVDFRIVGEQIYNSNLIEQQIIGFQNRSGAIFNHDNFLFDVVCGTGFTPNENKEGIRKNNFYATYLIGPLLVRNPYFTEYLIKELLEDKNIKYTPKFEGIEFRAYDEFIKNYLVK